MSVRDNRGAQGRSMPPGPVPPGKIVPINSGPQFQAPIPTLGQTTRPISSSVRFTPPSPPPTFTLNNVRPNSSQRIHFSGSIRIGHAIPAVPHLQIPPRSVVLTGVPEVGQILEVPVSTFGPSVRPGKSIRISTAKALVPQPPFLPRGAMSTNVGPRFPTPVQYWNQGVQLGNSGIGIASERPAVPWRASTVNAVPISVIKVGPRFSANVQPRKQKIPGNSSSVSTKSAAQISSPTTAENSTLKKMPDTLEREQLVLSCCIICKTRFCKSWHLEYDIWELLHGKKQVCHSCYMANEKLKPNNEYASEIVSFFNQFIEVKHAPENQRQFDQVQEISSIQNEEIEHFILMAGENYLGYLRIDPQLIVFRRSAFELKLALNTHLQPESNQGLSDVKTGHGRREIKRGVTEKLKNATPPAPANCNQLLTIKQNSASNVIVNPEAVPKLSQTAPKTCPSTSVLGLGDPSTVSTEAQIEIKPHEPSQPDDWCTTHIVSPSVVDKSTDKKYDWGISCIPANASEFLTDNNLLNPKEGSPLPQTITVRVSLKLVQETRTELYIPYTFKIAEPHQNSPHRNLARFSISWARRLGASRKMESSVEFDERASETIFQGEIFCGGSLLCNLIMSQDQFNQCNQTYKSQNEQKTTLD